MQYNKKTYFENLKNSKKFSLLEILNKTKRTKNFFYNLKICWTQNCIAFIR